MWARRRTARVRDVNVIALHRPPTDHDAQRLRPGGVALAAGTAERSAPPAYRPDPVKVRRFALLSERELDVVRLLARGMSNAEIAGELYLSEGTVKTYVTRTLNKLRLRSRVQIVVAAYDAGLVTPNGGRVG